MLHLSTTKTCSKLKLIIVQQIFYKLLKVYFHMKLWDRRAKSRYIPLKSSGIRNDHLDGWTLLDLILNMPTKMIKWAFFNISNTFKTGSIKSWIRTAVRFGGLQDKVEYEYTKSRKIFKYRLCRVTLCKVTTSAHFLRTVLI